MLWRIPALCFMAALPMVAVSDYRAAPSFDILQRMQGQWQRHCYPSVEGRTKIYRRDFLVVSFTHLDFESKVYLDDACNVQRTRHSASYLYSLTGAFFETKGGQKAFALNAQAEAPKSRFFKFPSLNIAAIDLGKLYFGRDFSGESEAGLRLSRLDVVSPFIRH